MPPRNAACPRRLRRLRACPRRRPQHSGIGPACRRRSRSARACQSARDLARDELRASGYLRAQEANPNRAQSSDLASKRVGLARASESSRDWSAVLRRITKADLQWIRGDLWSRVAQDEPGADQQSRLLRNCQRGHSGVGDSRKAIRGRRFAPGRHGDCCPQLPQIGTCPINRVLGACRDGVFAAFPRHSGIRNTPKSPRAVRAGMAYGI
jgi:hypothetical protein